MAELFLKSNIPEHFWEPGIVSGYRRPGLTIKESLHSLLHLHNESLNIWTHFCSMIFFLIYFYIVSLSLELYQEEKYNPMLCIFVTTIIFTSGSSLAHTFNSMSECSHDIGFMVDYFGISLYAFATALSNFTYAFPKEWRGTIFCNTFLFLNALTSTLAVLLACRSKFVNHLVKRKIMRLSGFVLAYITSMAPLFYRVIMTYSIYDATLHYWRHFIAGFFTATFFASHFPESVFPGKFDIFFHSHQIFHVAVSSGTYFKITGLLADIRSGYPIITVQHSIAIMTVVTLINGLVALYNIYQKYLFHRDRCSAFHSCRNQDELINNNNSHEKYD
ncbi:membrane progestin receptor gamma-A-like [Watersipora subatra]|uniref:membrane progestin receptor gamma-A-like n=1 Tax=Watersipora subatra TaxID=2589382 RepID=UPI00355B442F